MYRLFKVTDSATSLLKPQDFSSLWKMQWSPTPGLSYKVMTAGSSDYHSSNTQTRAQRHRLVLGCSELEASLAILSCCALCGLVHLESMNQELFQDQSLQLYTAFHRHLGVQDPWWVVFLLDLEKAGFNPCHHTTPRGQPFTPFVVGETCFSTFTC